jgi:hypothetical protein
MSNPRYLQQGFEKRLSHAIEECGQFLASAGKLQRLGPFSVNPELPREMQEPNIDLLFRKAMDVQEVIERLIESIQKGEYASRKALDEAGRRQLTGGKLEANTQPEWLVPKRRATDAPVSAVLTLVKES